MTGEWLFSLNVLAYDMFTVTNSVQMRPIVMCTCSLACEQPHILCVIVGCRSVRVSHAGIPVNPSLSLSLSELDDHRPTAPWFKIASKFSVKEQEVSRGNTCTHRCAN